MRLSTLTPLALASTALAGSPHTPIARDESKSGASLDLSNVPILSIVSALLKKLPVDANVSVLPDVDVTGIANCVTNALDVHLHVSAFPSTTSSMAQTTIVTVTKTTYVSPTDAAAPAPEGKRDIHVGAAGDLLPDIPLDLGQVPLLTLVTGLVDKLPVDVGVDALPNGLDSLKELDLEGLVKCIGGKVQGGSGEDLGVGL